jgi:nucleotide-binding universal stress UspA family protein
MRQGGPVVVGFDGSESAVTAAQWAAGEAKSRGVALQLIHAFTPPVGGLGVGYATAVGTDIIDQLREGAQVAVDGAAATLREANPGVEVTTNVVIGNPSGALIDASAGASLVAVGSRGLGGFRGLLLGSVGVQVATHAECPAVVLRGAAPAGASQVVVGIDGSQMARDALAFAFDIASRRGWDLIALHAWDVPSSDVLAAPNGPAPVTLAQMGDTETRTTAEALAGYRETYPDVDVEERVVKGTTVKAILKAAEGAALIVVGSRGRGEVAGAILGSVSQGILHKAKVPVAVVHHVSGEGDA